MSIKGECACGAIKAEIPTPKESALCHCTQCRRTGGGNSSTNFVVARDAIKVSGSPKMFIDKGDSGKPVQRYFCGECGSPIYADCDSAPHVSFVRGGLFNPGDVPKPTMHLFTKNLESWEKPIEGAQTFETEPEF